MLTDFGKLCRMTRIEHGELLKDMAAKLDVTAAYLSAVETGKRNVPKEWPEIIAREYNLDESTYKKFQCAASILQLTSKMHDVSMDVEDKDMMIAFARKLNTMDKTQKEKLLRGINIR